jgi:hypothetical protein
MSEEKKELSLLDELKAEQAQYLQQRDLHQANLNQVIGAIYAVEQTIKKIEAKELAKAMHVDDEIIEPE